MLKDFTEAARALTKNPLGIIGLFIVLVYGFACLVFGLSGAHLEKDESLILTWFIVSFPVLILATFYRLVTAHHRKLYAPGDFRDEANFNSAVTPLSEKAIATKQEEEIKRIESSERSATEPREFVKRQELLIRSSYADAEKLGFLAIENELGKAVQKHVSVKIGDKDIEFDGFLIEGTKIHIIEIKYYSRPNFKREFLESILFRASEVFISRLFEADEKLRVTDAVLWIVFVVEFDKAALPNFERAIEHALKSNLISFTLKFFHIDDLRIRFSGS